MIAVGQKLPNATLYEFIDEATEGCAMGPNTFEVEKLTAGKKIVIFALPGAFTPTCSAQHVPGYLAQYDALNAKGVDEIWCISVNDPFVMGAWGRDLKVGKKIRMFGDGSAEFTKKLGMEFDLIARGLGVRSQRYAMIVQDGVVKTLDLEAPGKFEVSDAASVLKQL
ncbi:peroxiredoxin [Polynucleobacter paneuropaeus]|uniref:Glutathione-dependent peroxiredoxin n=1 Tax=Polynucleobacter paneuropaeus TaxID=2527775 RepID=A0AAE3CI73_9BURK|nr:peroxiredoxin [Polynucleobacter paneuropaeus]MBT8539309.1 peroxiredoxin [Polynucleobacter paneuropaeus]MBT8588940.1 peroxiredoxin [Polynucleobacter paneuropaeus]MBT8591689.1 peroxiredoxin [Polynucleobacter paneuropaeus]MBT8597079.1 peroxiredoxin [Polynucleobacter paneuropaeus]